MEYITHNGEETTKVMADLASQFCGGDVVALYGDLGSGKTTSVKAIAKALGIESEITSPTFVIMKNYLLPSPVQGINELVHLDAYRLHGAPDAESIGLEEYLERNDVLIFVEWPENIANILPTDFKTIKFTHLNGDSRKIDISL